MDKDNLKTKEGCWWRQGVTLFTEVSSWIAFPIIFALVIGKSLDKYFGTKPLFFLTLIGLSFFVSCLGIYKIIKKYMKNLITEEEIEKYEHEAHE